MSVASDLLRLQQIDLDIMRNTKIANELPHKERIQKLRKASKATQTELTKLTGKRKDLEMELDDNAAAKQAASDQVDEAQLKAEESEQSYREIQDLETQLSSLAKRLEKLDYDRERLNAELEQVMQAEHQKEVLIKRATEEEATQLSEYKAELDRLARLVDALRYERISLIEDLPSDLLSNYEAASKRFNGLAVESLQDNKPSVCRVALQPSQFSQISSEDGITECPYCRRILITRS